MLSLTLHAVQLVYVPCISHTSPFFLAITTRRQLLLLPLSSSPLASFYLLGLVLFLPWGFRLKTYLNNIVDGPGVIFGSVTLLLVEEVRDGRVLVGSIFLAILEVVFCCCCCVRDVADLPPPEEELPPPPPNKAFLLDAASFL